MVRNENNNRLRDNEGLTLLEAMVIILKHRWVLTGWVVAVAALIVVQVGLGARWCGR